MFIYLKKNEYGLIIGIHNITSNTLHFTNCFLKIINQKKEVFIDFDKIEKSNYILIKPDDMVKIKIDFTLLDIDKQSKIKIVLEQKYRKISKKVM